MLGINDLYLRCHLLSELNLSGCFDLTHEGTFLQCPNLRSIDISSCRLGEDNSFEKDLMKHLNVKSSSSGSGSNIISTNGKKVSIIKGGIANDWMTTNF